MRLKDKVALVTGAGSGIGKAIAVRFAAEGAHVVINYHPGGKHGGAEVQAEIAKRNQSAIAIAADVDQRGGVEDMFRQIVARFGPLGIAVNNAGIRIKKPFLQVTDCELTQMI